MFYNHCQTNDFDFNECSGRGACSIAPNITSFQEVMLIFMRQSAYYLLKLETFGDDYKDMKMNIIRGIASLVSTTEYSDEQLLNLIGEQYSYYVKLKRLYKNECIDTNSCKELKSIIELTPDMSLSEILRKGEKLFVERYVNKNQKQKCLAEILFVIIKSVCISLVKLNDYGIENNNAVEQTLHALNIYNYRKLPVKKVQDKISELVKTDLELWKIRNKAQKDTYGGIEETCVSYSTVPNKAILASGSSLADLYSLLEFAKNEDIDVYSHGDLLISHAFKKFKEFPRFKGHFGTGNDNCILDFATFPGSILLTKHATQNLEYLIRGRLFTTDYIAPKGVQKIENNDFSDVIKASNEAKGFSKGQDREGLVIGFNPGEIQEKIKKIGEKFNSGEIKHIFLIGMSNYSPVQTHYFEKLLKLMPDDCFVITFSYHCHKKNELFINVAHNFPLQLTILDMLFKEVPINSDNITFFLTKCDSNTISSMISLKEKGAKNLFLSNCPPTVINPKVLNTFMNMYAIKQISTPKNDLEEVLNKEG